MTRLERNIDGLRINYLKKFFPFGVVIFLTGAAIFMAALHRHKVFSSEKKFNLYILKNFNKPGLPIQPLSQESSQAFFFISQTLSKSGFMRCDRYLPDPACRQDKFKNFNIKSFHELRHPVTITGTGFKRADINPPYHTLKNIIINSGNEEFGHMVFILYTGNGAGYRILKILNLLKRSQDKNHECKNRLYFKWHLIEDPYSYKVFQDEYDLKMDDLESPVQVFTKESSNHWKSSSVLKQKLTNYLNQNADTEPAMPDDSVWCQ